MSVITDASEALYKAKEHLREAVKQLSIFINPGTYGHDDYDAESIRKMTKLIRKLQKFI